MREVLVFTDVEVLLCGYSLSAAGDHRHGVDPLAAFLHAEVQVRPLNDLYLAGVRGLADDLALLYLLPGLDRKLLGKPRPGSRVLMRRFKRRGRLTDTPKVGDIIFLTNGDGLVSHCGIVVCVEDDTVTTVEGNTIDPTGGVFKRHEGGAVAQRVRKLTDPAIICYGGVDQHGRNQRI